MIEFIRELMPICRSITGDGVRQTLQRIGEIVPLEVHEVPSGTHVFDWQVPKEWNIREAFLVGPDGKRIVDFADHNLHVMSYSTPVDVELDLQDLQDHLHSIPDQPDLIPYRTSYYNENWAFCLPHALRESLPEGRYKARIDSTLASGSLSYGELFIPGQSDEEFLVYSHVCHPSIANDNLSGVAVTTWWAKHLLEAGENRLSYRFVWGPGTIGSITWLARNPEKIARIRHGLVAVLLGRPGEFHYKCSRSGVNAIDRIVAHVIDGTNSGSQVRPFDPYGYDERQFGSPGINLPVGRISRVPNGEYREYHTSADSLELISEDALLEALCVLIKVGQVVEVNRTMLNLAPNCEPQLGKRGLYRSTGGENPKEREHAMLWVLNLSDGSNSLLDIAEKSGISIDVISAVAVELETADLLEEV
jgi:aminopeptidase-like protein